MKKVLCMVFAASMTTGVVSCTPTHDADEPESVGGAQDAVQGIETRMKKEVFHASIHLNTDNKTPEQIRKWLRQIKTEAFGSPTATTCYQGAKGSKAQLAVQIEMTAEMFSRGTAAEAQALLDARLQAVLDEGFVPHLLLSIHDVPKAWWGGIDWPSLATLKGKHNFVPYPPCTTEKPNGKLCVYDELSKRFQVPIIEHLRETGLAAKLGSIMLLNEFGYTASVNNSLPDPQMKALAEPLAYTAGRLLDKGRAAANGTVPVGLKLASVAEKGSGWRAIGSADQLSYLLNDVMAPHDDIFAYDVYGREAGWDATNRSILAKYTSLLSGGRFLVGEFGRTCDEKQPPGVFNKAAGERRTSASDMVQGATAWGWASGLNLYGFNADNCYGLMSNGSDGGTLLPGASDELKGLKALVDRAVGQAPTACAAPQPPKNGGASGGAGVGGASQGGAAGAGGKGSAAGVGGKGGSGGAGKGGAGASGSTSQGGGKGGAGAGGTGKGGASGAGMGAAGVGAGGASGSTGGKGGNGGASGTGGAAPSCDGVVCPPCEACNQGACLPAGDGQACDDGDACTGAGTCAGGVCHAGSPISCDDNDVCTFDQCLSGTCEHTKPPSDCGALACGPSPSGCFSCGSCGAGLSCLGGQCVGGCAGGCDDGNPCSIDTCSSGSCQHVAVADSTPCQGGSCTAGACQPAQVGGPCSGGPWPSLTWLPGAAFPNGKDGSVTAAFYKNQLHTAGGQFYLAHFALDIVSNSWTKWNDLPKSASEGALLSVGGELYGFADTTFANGEAMKYETASDSWTMLSTGPFPRRYPVAGVFGTDVVLAGGFAGNDASVTIFSALTGSWSQVASLPALGGGVNTGVVLDNQLLLFGVSGGNSNPTQGQRFDSSAGTWSSLPSLAASRYGSRAAVNGGVVYLLGGSDNGAVSDSIWAFDPQAGLWCEAPFVLPEPLQLSALAQQGSQVALVGGVTSAGLPTDHVWLGSFSP